MKRLLLLLLFIAAQMSSSVFAAGEEDIFPEPRTMSVTANAGALFAAGLEARFQFALLPNLSLVFPVYGQKTPEIPWISLREKNRKSLFSIARANAGMGIRWHLSDEVGYSGWYLEPSARAGMTWVGKDKGVWSVIPSLIIGYTSIWPKGFTVALGFGLEYELLFGKKGYYTDFLSKAYYSFTKLPFTGELSYGYSW